jgi:hypothetical protein
MLRQEVALQCLAPLQLPPLQLRLATRLWTPPRQRCWVALLPAGVLRMLLRPLS